MGNSEEPDVPFVRRIFKVQHKRQGKSVQGHHQAQPRGSDPPRETPAADARTACQSVQGVAERRLLPPAHCHRRLHGYAHRRHMQLEMVRHRPARRIHRLRDCKGGRTGRHSHLRSAAQGAGGSRRRAGRWHGPFAVRLSRRRKTIQLQDRERRVFAARVHLQRRETLYRHGY